MMIFQRRGRVAPNRHNQEWSGIHAVVRRYALSRLRHMELAEDIAQQAVLKAIEYQQDNIVISLHALALRIAGNLISLHYRKSRPSDSLDAAEYLACTEPLPDRVAEGREEFKAMQVVLARMPALRRDVFLRRRLEGQSCDDIGRALNLNPKAVEKHITRALVDLRAARVKWHEDAPVSPVPEACDHA